ncbi:hypothetical protein C8Q76DRAFT_825149 [Earliella scabrosa]|nr:hypothetical protein C8Q76DRAFT_825149 [Earliella scabrosa]
MSFTSPLDDCVILSEVEPHHEHPSVLKQIVLKAMHPQDGELGALVALQIDRRRCRGEFLVIMDEESQELCEFANGRLKSEFVENEYHKGSGVWGRELDEGMLLYVLSVLVEKEEHKRRGVASRLLRELAHSTYAPPGSYGIAWPSPEVAGRPNTAPEGRQLKDVAVRVFHKNGYRRIGRTCFMAFTADDTHPSRSLSIEDDAQQQETRVEPGSVGGQDAGSTMPGMIAGYLANVNVNPLEDPACPLHILIAAGTIVSPIPEMAQKIRDAYSQDPSSVRKKDEHGFTPLHLAAHFGNLEALQTLLALPPSAGISEDLTVRDGTEGLTPLETCEREMRNKKEFAETVLGSWTGYPTPSLRVLYLLKRATGEVLQMSEDEFVESRWWGCTCGKCANGWLSPRMRYRLKTTAEVNADIMMDTSFKVRRGERIVSEYAAPGYEHLPEDLQEEGVSKSFYQGYEAVVRAIATVLQGEDRAGLPLVANVRGAMTPDAYSSGVEALHALDYVVYSAMEASPLGDNTWDELEADSDGEYAAMPQCENDLDFSRVAERLGLPGQQRFRGHGMAYTCRLDSDDSEEMDEDEDD